MTLDRLLRDTNRNMIAFDLALGTGALLAPTATLRVLGHDEPSEDARFLFQRCGPDLAHSLPLIWSPTAAAGPATGGPSPGCGAPSCSPTSSGRARRLLATRAPVPACGWPASQTWR